MPVIGHIEFEFWAENEVVYDRLIIYVFGAFLTLGTCICCCLNLMFKQGIQEELDSVRHRLWRLRGKSKDYLDENAPNVLEFVRLKEELTRDEESPFGKPGEAAPGKTNKQRIHELENELEDPWCCPTGLAPIRSVKLAVFLCIFNILSPGLGTFSSMCCFKNQPNMVAPEQPPPAEEAEEDEEEEQEEEAKPKAPDPPKRPAVMSFEKIPIDKSKFGVLRTALAQFLTAPCGIGWLWSMSHGCVFVQNALIYQQIDAINAEASNKYAAEQQEEDE